MDTFFILKSYIFGIYIVYLYYLWVYSTFKLISTEYLDLNMLLL